MKLHRISLQGIIAILLSLPLICNSLVFAEGWTVESLQKEIDARGYKWKAGKTFLSKFSPEELQMMFPQKLPYTIRMMPAEEEVTVTDSLPAYLDWRNYKGGNWITPVKRQGMCGCCYIFAPVGAMETLIKLYHDDPDLPIDLSEQYLVSCGPSGKRGEYNYGGCKGGYPDITVEFLVNSGLPDESCFPYRFFQYIGSEPPCTKACADVATRVHKLSSYSFIGGEGLHIQHPLFTEFDELFIPYPEYIKEVLVKKPISCGMLLNPIDWAFYTGGIYEPTPGPIVGHLVEVIGFDDEQQCWICKNSQSTDWGETADFLPYTPGAGDGGYFRVFYVTSEDTETYFGMFALEMNYDGGPPLSTSTTTTITCPSKELYGEGSEELELLRSFRDDLLSKTREGQEIIKLYYKWGPDIVRAIRESEEFKEELKKMIDGIFPLISRQME